METAEQKKLTFVDSKIFIKLFIRYSTQESLFVLFLAIKASLIKLFWMMEPRILSKKFDLNLFFSKYMAKSKNKKYQLKWLKWNKNLINIFLDDKVWVGFRVKFS